MAIINGVIFIPRRWQRAKFDSSAICRVTRQLPTPYAFDIASDGSLTLYCTNFADKNLEGELFYLTQNGEVSHLATVPRLSEERKSNPMELPMVKTTAYMLLMFVE